MTPLRRVIAYILLEDLDPFGSALSLLKKVDNSDYHMLALDAMPDQERDQADRLVMRGLLRRLPARGRFPDRYVVTSGGSHALGTFDWDTLRDEDAEDAHAWKRRKRRERSKATLGRPAVASVTVGEGHDAWRHPGLSDEALDDEAEQRANRSLERGPEWLASQRERLEAMPFERLLKIVRWNDPNGAWSDRELQEYETDHETLVDTLMGWVEDGLETPEEWMAGSTRPFSEVRFPRGDGTVLGMDDQTRAAKLLMRLFKNQTDDEPVKLSSCQAALARFGLDLEKVRQLKQGIEDADPAAEDAWPEIRWFITDEGDK